MGPVGLQVSYLQDSFNRRNTSLPRIETYSKADASLFLNHGANIITLEVHNQAITNKLFVNFTLRLDSGEYLVQNDTKCSTVLGYFEPSGYFFDPVPSPQHGWDVNPPDWIELYNNGTTAVNITDWSLSDDLDYPRKYVFPNTTIINPQSYLVIFMDQLNYIGQYQHTSFDLDSSGGSLYLYNNKMREVSRINYPEQSPFYSYGISESGAYVYYSEMTPENANNETNGAGGSTRLAILSPPIFDFSGGIYASEINVTITSPNSTSIYYTLNGKSPNSSFIKYVSPITVKSNTVIRAVCVAPGFIESTIITNTYLINITAKLLIVPSIVLSGDPNRTLYKPEGILAINGGYYDSTGQWFQSNSTSYGDYNSIIIKNGDGIEKEASIAIYASNPSNSMTASDMGLSASSSGYSLSRFRLTWDKDLDNPNMYSKCDSRYKPSFNIDFRKEYGSSRINKKIIPYSSLSSHKSFRLRPGKNDPCNPFIMDEYARRLFYDISGGYSVVGILANLYVNSGLKGMYNLVEKVGETWYQEKYAIPDTVGMDILKVSTWVQGDNTYFLSMLKYIATQDWRTNETKWRYVIEELLDMENIVDYLIVNTWGSTWDWPGNNFYFSRARMPGKLGRFRYTMWDAEGLLLSGRYNYSTFNSDLIVASPSLVAPNTITPSLFTLMYNSTEVQMLWADRVHKAFSAGGAMEVQNIFKRWNDLAYEMNVTYGAMWNDVLSEVRFKNFTDGNYRHTLYFNQLRTLKFWNDISAPVFQSTSTFEVSGSITVNVSSVNASTQIYYTTDGSDPRAFGGSVAGKQLNQSSIVITKPTLLCARAYNGSLWSPKQCTSYSVTSNYTLAITEVHYNPSEGSNYEFIEIKNTGELTMDMSNLVLYINDVPTYTFPQQLVLQPQSFYVLCSDPGSFHTSTLGIVANHTFNMSLPNGGATVSLVYMPLNETVVSFTYNSSDPWPQLADGLGFSLVPVDTNPVVSDPSYQRSSSWRSSTHSYGSPFFDDPTPIDYKSSSGIVINEVSIITNMTSTYLSIELFNPTTVPIDVNNWWITNAFSKPYKYLINADDVTPQTIINAGDYLVITPDFPSYSSNGDDVILFSGSSRLVVTGYYDMVEYSKVFIPTNTSFGLHTSKRCGKQFVSRTETVTLGSSNTEPISPSSIVISSFNLDPHDVSLQYVEITSLLSFPIQLSGLEVQSSKSKSIYKFSSGVLPAFSKIRVANYFNDSTMVVTPSIHEGFSGSIYGPFLVPFKSPEIFQRIAVATSTHVHDELFYNPKTFNDNINGCYTKTNYWLTSADPCSWISCDDPVDVNSNYTSSFDLTLLYDENNDGVIDDTDVPLVNVSVCLIPVPDGTQLLCMNTDDDGHIMVDTYTFPGVSFDQKMMFFIDNYDQNLNSEAPYAYPIQSKYVSENRLFSVVSWTFVEGLSDSQTLLFTSSPFQIEIKVTLQTSEPVPNITVNLVDQTGSAVLSSYTSNTEGIILISENDFPSESLNLYQLVLDQNADVHLRLDLGQLANLSYTNFSSWTVDSQFSWNVTTTSYSSIGLTLSHSFFLRNTTTTSNITLIKQDPPQTEPQVPSTPISTGTTSSPSSSTTGMSTGQNTPVVSSGDSILNSLITILLLMIISMIFILFL
eukprot:TRINITY_DN3148_c0_g1_i1.p1 TRINITY_DN3148_c0_g1~~TRINITY_DN3148_c0_g1_i1.p1  ORF type:complete len:1778 (-),score=380.20 TRINITY_DN3148_c0_g1_i1:227-5104(-)